MKVLLSFLLMGVIALFAAVLVAVQALIKLLPLLVAALLVVAAVRFWERRRRGPGVAPPAAPQPPALRPAAPPPQPLRSPPVGGWVLVPVWMDAAGRPQLRRPVIDAEVISEDGWRRG
jgi:hypothetical protein